MIAHSDQQLENELEQSWFTEAVRRLLTKFSRVLVKNFCVHG
jgi:hypothetical protein